VTTTQTLLPAKLPFKEAIAHFRQKENLGTDYYGINGSLHDRAFMVAGVAKEDMLAGLRAAVDKAMAEGTTLADFKKEFAAIADKWEWDPKGGKGWRARVIYETNLRAAHAAGRYKQLTEMLDTNPYWQYRHGSSIKPRPEHEALDGLVLRGDDAWWDKNYPPNGWGCQCYVIGLTEGQVRRRGLTVTSGDGLPDVSSDPNWQHAHGRQSALWPSEEPRGDTSKQAKGGGGTTIEMDGYATSGTPPPLPPRGSGCAALPYDKTLHQADAAARQDACIKFIKNEVLGGMDSALFNVECGDFRLPIVIDAAGLGGHLADDPGRLAWLGYLPDLLAPQEVWTDFRGRIGKDGRLGKVSIGWKLLTRVQGPKGTEGLMLLAQNNGLGCRSAYTLYPLPNIDTKRTGRLMARRK